MKTNYGLAAIALDSDTSHRDNILHFRLYENEPSVEIITSLIKELSTNKKHNMIGMVEGIDYSLIQLSEEALKRTKSYFAIPDII